MTATQGHVFALSAAAIFQKGQQLLKSDKRFLPFFELFENAFVKNQKLKEELFFYNYLLLIKYNIIYFINLK